MTIPHITTDPQIMSGTPCFTGTRVPVATLFDYLKGSSTLNDFLGDFPSVSQDMAVGVLRDAYRNLTNGTDEKLNVSLACVPCRVSTAKPRSENSVGR